MVFLSRLVLIDGGNGHVVVVGSRSALGGSGCVTVDGGGLSLGAGARPGRYGSSGSPALRRPSTINTANAATNTKMLSLIHI
nr:hypothetical protein [Arthrobacter sp. KBS0703]